MRIKHAASLVAHSNTVPARAFVAVTLSLPHARHKQQSIVWTRYISPTLESTDYVFFASLNFCGSSSLGFL